MGFIVEQGKNKAMYTESNGRYYKTVYIWREKLGCYVPGSKNRITKEEYTQRLEEHKKG